MHGGYQIIDLTKVIVGTETKVDGVYKTIRGFNGKPVFIITPNTSGIFAEFTENSGMYIGAYIGSNGHLFTVSIISSDQVTITDKGPAGGGGTSNYNELSNKPAIAGTTLSGDKSLSELGIQAELTPGTNISIDERNNISADIDSMPAADVTFDHTSTGMLADDAQAAIVELQTNKTAKTDITSIICTGTTNATGSTIVTGSEFYLNEVLCKATVDIVDGATFTLNTNYITTTVADELTELNSNLTAGRKWEMVQNVQYTNTVANAWENTGITFNAIAHIQYGVATNYASKRPIGIGIIRTSSGETTPLIGLENANGVSGIIVPFSVDETMNVTIVAKREGKASNTYKIYQLF